MGHECYGASRSTKTAACATATPRCPHGFPVPTTSAIRPRSTAVRVPTAATPTVCVPTTAATPTVCVPTTAAATPAIWRRHGLRNGRQNRRRNEHAGCRHGWWDEYYGCTSCLGGSRSGASSSSGSKVCLWRRIRSTQLEALRITSERSNMHHKQTIKHVTKRNQPIYAFTLQQCMHAVLRREEATASLTSWDSDFDSMCSFITDTV